MSWSEEDASFWENIVRPDGNWDIEQIKSELADYRSLLSEVPKVYCAITDGQISRPNTHAAVVMAIHEDVCHQHCTDECDDVI